MNMTFVARGALLRGASVAVALLLAFGLTPLSARAADVVASGAFYDGPHAPQHKVSGRVDVVRRADGGYELDFADFVSDAGPDVVVIVSTAERPTADRDIRGSDYLSVGARKALTGTQRYLLPASYDPDKYHSVGIWCASYAVLFGAAALEAR